MDQSAVRYRRGVYSQCAEAPGLGMPQLQLTRPHPHIGKAVSSKPHLRCGFALDYRTPAYPVSAGTTASAACELAPRGDPRRHHEKVSVTNSTSARLRELAGSPVTSAPHVWWPDEPRRSRHSKPMVPATMQPGRSLCLSRVLHSWVFGPRSAMPLLISCITSALVVRVRGSDL